MAIITIAQPQILRETGVIGGNDNSPETKFLSDKGLKIVDMHKESLSPVDQNGERIKVTPELFDKLKQVREEKIKKDISDLMQKGAIIWEDGTEIKAENLTPKQLERWLMNHSKKATKEAVDEVFGEQPEKEDASIINTNE